MHDTDPDTTPHTAEPEPMVTVPASVLADLLERVTRLEATTSALREQLGAVALRPLVNTETTGEESTDLPAQPGRKGHGAAVQLFSRLATEVGKPFTEIDAGAKARGELLADIHAKVAPFVTAFTQEMFSRIPATDTGNAKLPRRPAFEQSPADYAKYIKKHGKTIEWEEKDGFKTHKLSLTYLPGELPELVKFGVASEEKKADRAYSSSVDLHMNEVEFTLDHSSLASLSVKHAVSMGSYPKPLRIISDDYEVAVELGSELSITKRGYTEKKPTTYVYSNSDQAFLDTTHTQPGTVKTPLSTDDCLEQLDKALAVVPTQPV